MRKILIFIPIMFLLFTGVLSADSIGYTYSKTEIDAIKVDTEGLQVSVTQDSTVIQEIIDHLDEHDHGKHWLMSKKALQTGTSKADSLALSFYDFELTAAADSTYGTPVQLLGPADTPVVAGFALFDVHEVVITAVNSNELYKMRIAWGATSAAAVAAGDYTDLWVWSDTTNPQNVSNSGLEVQAPTLAAGTLLWVSIANAAGAQTMSMKFTLLEHN